MKMQRCIYTGIKSAYIINLLGSTIKENISLWKHEVSEIMGGKKWQMEAIFLH